jgi:hypothetical protein
MRSKRPSRSPQAAHPLTFLPAHLQADFWILDSDKISTCFPARHTVYYSRHPGQRTALLDGMNVRQTTRKVPDSWDTMGPDPSGLLDSFSPAFLRGRAHSENAYKMRTKCDHFRECEFFNSSLANTYNFEGVKCTHFLEVLLLLPAKRLKFANGRPISGFPSLGSPAVGSLPRRSSAPMRPCLAPNRQPVSGRLYRMRLYETETDINTGFSAQTRELF